MKKWYKYIKPYLPAFILGPLCMIVEVLGEMVLPKLLGSIIDYGVTGEDAPEIVKFLYSIFSRHFIFDSLDFFKSIGIDTYSQEDGRIFPVSNSSKDVKDKMLKEFFKYKNAKLVNKKIENLSDLKEFDHIVVSCGSRGVGELIKTSGHTVAEFKPSLCALNIIFNI